MRPKPWLVAGGVLSAAAALLHLAIILGGPPLYRLFGAGERMVHAAEMGSIRPALITSGIALILLLWALYAFSGAGLIRRLPLLRTGLVLISAIYLLRGLAPVPMLILQPERVDAFVIWSSLTVLIYGICYAIGTWLGWRRLAPPGHFGHQSSMTKPAEPVAEAKPRNALWRELKFVVGLLLVILPFHSLVAKPFYIPSESMMPNLLVGDHLVVTKYPYGWSYASASFHVLPFIEGRLAGALPERGDVVIALQPTTGHDLIKRVIGLPGDTIAVSGGIVYLNGRPIPRQQRPPAMIPIDANTKCDFDAYGDFRVTGADGRLYCRLPIFRETLPNGRSYDTIDLGNSSGDNFARVTVPEGHVFLMGDNRDDSADSRFPVAEHGLGGPVPWENLGGRAEFITFSLDGSASYWNPVSWFAALRGDRAGTSLHAERGPPQQ
jgi:signal peptidase I